MSFSLFIAVLVDNFQLSIRKKKLCKSQKSPDVKEGETQSSEKAVEDLEMSQAEIEEELHKEALRHASSGSKHSKRKIELTCRHLQLLAAMDQHMQKYRSQACLLDNLVETFFTSFSVMKVTLLLLLLSVVAMMSTCHLQLYKRGAGPGCPLGKRLVFDFKAMHDESKRLNNEYFDCPNPEPGVSWFYYSHIFHPFFVIEDTVVGESDRFLDSYTFKVVGGGRTRGSVRNYSQEEILKFNSLSDSESSQQTLVWTYDDVPDSFLLTKEGFILMSGTSNKCQNISVMKVTLLLLLLSVVAMMATCNVQLSKRGAGPGCPLGKRLVFDLNATLEESKHLNNEYFDCPNPEPGVPCFYYSHDKNPLSLQTLLGGISPRRISPSAAQLQPRADLSLYTFKVVRGGRTRGSVRNYSQEEILKFKSLNDSESSQQTLVWTYDDVPDSFLLTKEGFILMSGASNKRSSPCGDLTPVNLLDPDFFLVIEVSNK
ncbi:hypothetical protein AOLI_G00026300 [Acnodon oligacanthus]